MRFNSILGRPVHGINIESHYSIYFLFILVIALSMKAFFRTLAAAFPKEAPAQAVAGVSFLALSLYTGYQIPRPSMIVALRWISYINARRILI